MAGSLKKLAFRITGGQKERSQELGRLPWPDAADSGARPGEPEPAGLQLAGLPVPGPVRSLQDADVQSPGVGTEKPAGRHQDRAADVLGQQPARAADLLGVERPTAEPGEVAFRQASQSSDCC